MDNIITATADIVAVGEDPESIDFINGIVPIGNVVHKVGRPPKINSELERII